MKKSSIALVCGLALLSASCTSNTTTEPVGVLTDALDSSVWENSEWISVVDAPTVKDKVITDNDFRAADGASWFLSTVKNEKKLVDARWMTSGLGVFQLYVNGKEIGKEVLKPGFTDYRKTKYSFTYNVLEAMNTGAGAENVFAAQVTPGWWADKIITPGNKTGMVGDKVAFRGVLELTYDDGSKELLGTNTEDWLAGIAGPVTHAGIYDGEEYDARILPGYMTPEKLSKPEVNTEFNGTIFPTDGAEVYVREDLALAPVEAYKYSEIEGATDDEYGKVVVAETYKPGQVMELKPGETIVVDFGQNASAVPAFEFKAQEGTTLTFLPAELLNDGNGAKSRGMDGPEGSVHRLNLRIPDNGLKVIYTFGDNKGYVTYQPTTTFFGYRFAALVADGDVTIKSIKSLPVTSISKDMEIGTIVTDNEEINKLISNTMWGMRSNYLSVPTDCPQRNERLGWTADTQVFTETGTFFANTDKFFHKWTRDMRDIQSDLGGFPGVAPIAQYGSGNNEMMRVGWADAGVIVPWTVWKQYGDNAIVDENWDAMEKYMDHVTATKYDFDTVKDECGGFSWADWLSYEPLESCSGRCWGENGLRPETIAYWNYLNASYWLIDANMMVDMAKATGRDAAKFEAMAAEAKQYIQDNFVNADGTFKNEILNTMQTPALFALKNNIFEGEAKDNLIARLRQNFADHDNCLQTGFLGTSILMPTLTENGMSDIAYELLFQHKNPSWLYSIDNGATTIWERWNSYMIENGMGPNGMNSFNHYAYGAVCQWMWENMAGIAADPAVPGFKRIIMKPVPDKRLGSVTATYNSAAGEIMSAWRYEGDKWLWTFTVPEGAVAEVTLPGQTESQEYGAGTHAVEVQL